MKKKIILSSMLLLVSNLQSMQNDFEITAESIIPLMQKKCPLPQELEESVKVFLQNHRAGLLTILTQPRAWHNDVEKEHQENVRLLTTNGYQNISSHNNYCFEIHQENDTKGFITFVPSIINKLENLSTVYPITKENTAEILKKPTFLSISHAAAYIRYLKLKNKLNIRSVRLPEVYLVNIYGSEVSHATDENHLLIKNDIRYKPININDINPAVFKDLLSIIYYLPVSKITHETLQEDSDGFIYLNPREDDFQHRPDNFYFKNKIDFKYHAYAGLRSVFSLVKHNAQKEKIFCDFVKNNCEIELDSII